MKNIKRYDQFLLENLDDWENQCRHCGAENSFPTKQEMKKKGIKRAWCKNCGYLKITYDDKTEKLKQKFKNEIVKKYEDFAQISFNIIKYDNKEYGIFLGLIRVWQFYREQKAGYGTKIMNEIIQFADTNDLFIELTASDYYGSNLNRLIKFYKKFGFKEVKHGISKHESSMYRYPYNQNKEYDLKNTQNI